jgi:ribosome biogenesis protein Tsr3
VKLAAQYELPVWNFWASVQHLSTKGIDPEDDMYLSDEGYALHQRDGIKVLDLVWHELNSN